jgi:hypothetical protein
MSIQLKNTIIQFILICIFLIFIINNEVKGDIYIHNPRGSNSRNCERGANRNNANLICDTQNNAAGK